MVYVYFLFVHILSHLHEVQKNPPPVITLTHYVKFEIIQKDRH